MAKQSSGLLGSLGFVKSPGAPVPHRKHTSACETVEMPVPAICNYRYVTAHWCTLYTMR